MSDDEEIPVSENETDIPIHTRTISVDWAAAMGNRETTWEKVKRWLRHPIRSFTHWWTIRQAVKEMNENMLTGQESVGKGVQKMIDGKPCPKCGSDSTILTNNHGVPQCVECGYTRSNVSVVGPDGVRRVQ